MFKYGMFGSCGGFMIIPILLIGLIIFGIYKVIKNKNTKESKRDDFQNTLMERYARGEISEEEYHKMKNLLEK